jgi:hypothetical protein
MKPEDITHQADQLQEQYRYLHTAVGIAMSHRTEARWKNQRRNMQYWDQVVCELKSRRPAR